MILIRVHELCLRLVQFDLSFRAVPKIKLKCFQFDNWDCFKKGWVLVGVRFYGDMKGTVSKEKEV